MENAEKGVHVFHQYATSRRPRTENNATTMNTALQCAAQLKRDFQGKQLTQRKLRQGTQRPLLFLRFGRCVSCVRCVLFLRSLRLLR